MSSLIDNIEQIHKRIASAAQRARRDPADILLLGVTKTVPPEDLDAALGAGIVTFGENKVQEAKAKIPLVSSRAHWHFIGHLQSNKARDAVALFDVIHSIDSVKLAVELDKCAEREGKTQPVLLEVNLAGEASKHGMRAEDVPSAFALINQLSRLEVRGLMTVPPYVEEPEKVRPFFRQLRLLRDQLGLRELSMGMSHDFEVAIEEGSTIVRVGTAIFGKRKKYEPAE